MNPIDGNTQQKFIHMIFSIHHRFLDQPPAWTQYIAMEIEVEIIRRETAERFRRLKSSSDHQNLLSKFQKEEKEIWNIRNQQFRNPSEKR